MIAACLSCQHAFVHLDARRAQPRKSATIDLRVRIPDGRHDTCHARRDQRIRAGWRLAVVDARLKGHIDGGRRGRLRAGLRQSLGFGMRAPARLRPAPANHPRFPAR